MKMRIASLSLLTILSLALSAPVFAQIYISGPINGNFTAYEINLGQAVSNSFTVGTAADIYGIMFGEWVPAGEMPVSVEYQIGSTSFGNQYTDQVGSIIPAIFCYASTSCGHNSYDVYLSKLTFSGVSVPSGTLWLTLQNANFNGSGLAGWDSLTYGAGYCAGCTTLGPQGEDQIPSESFTILGSAIGGTTPEPSSIILFGSGILGLAGILRRKLNI